MDKVNRVANYIQGRLFYFISKRGRLFRGGGRGEGGGGREDVNRELVVSPFTITVAPSYLDWLPSNGLSTQLKPHE